LLTVLFAVALYAHLWRASAWIFVILVLYVGLVRVTTCRVETLQHRPCRWRVRGFFRTCDYHVGMKRVLPTLFRSPGAGPVLPMLMWPRPDLEVTFDHVDPQPSPSASGLAALAPRDRRLAGYSPEFWVGLVGVVVAFAALLRDLIAGS
jgi:hypothetical protein